MRAAHTGEGDAPEFALTIAEGHGSGQRFDFDRVEITVGRNPENDLVLSHGNVSRCHFAIRYAGTKYLIRDEGSSNGTVVNGEQVRKSLLSDGDEIRVGPFTLLFSTGSATVRQPIPTESADNRTPTGERPMPPAGPGSVRGARPLSRAGERGGRRASGPAPRRIEPVRRRRVSGKMNYVLDRVRSSLTPLKSWIAAQDRTTQMLIYALSGVVGLLVLLMLVVLAIRGGSGGENLSAQVIDLPAAGIVGPFGYCGDDETHPDEVRVGFAYRDGRATLEYSVYNISASGEVVLRVNGIDLGDVPLSAGKWTEGIRITLPKKHLLERTDNMLVFDNTKNPPERREWAVGDLRVIEEPLPKGDAVKAREYLERGRKRYQNRRIGHENLYRAWEFFRLARDYMEELDPKPDIYEEANMMVETCRKELDAQFASGMFRIHRAQEYDNYAEAQNEAQRLLRYFPSPEDRRYREVKELLEGLGD